MVSHVPSHLEEQRAYVQAKILSNFGEDQDLILIETSELAMYGNEGSGFNTALFTREDAHQALKEAKQTFASCKKLVKGWRKS